tara:strand:- start:233 stop:829 length:597 start_codon:yes stop_codon:yes gene_type:complete
MFLRAVAVYEKNKDDQYMPVKSASDSIYKKSYLRTFEQDSLPAILDQLASNQLYANQSGRYFHYAKYNADTGHICVLVSERELHDVEPHYLLINVNHVDQRSRVVNTSLDDIVKNPLNYTGKDIQLGGVKEQVAATKVVLLKTVEGVLERGERLEILEEHTVRLVASSEEFRKSATALNSGCCGQYVPSVSSITNKFK